MLRTLIFALAAAAVIASGSAADARQPELKRQGSVPQLLVDGKPYLILSGELGNSSASHRAALLPYWPKLKRMGLNTVLAPVSWELVEPEEGRLDWSSIDALIADARAHDMRLVLLWFGSWKNSMSTYVPSWVKRDRKRFTYAVDCDGKTQEILSAFSNEAMQADARAFAALMRYLRTADGQQQTVLMVQVENEVGFLPTARETGAAADRLFSSPVPNQLSQSGKGWAEVYGDRAPEHFMAWHYANYVEHVAKAGKREYGLPLFVNGAQGRQGKPPGEYPSGGPLAHLAKEWRLGAPSIDFIAPDIYFPNFHQIIADYAAVSSPLFVPEANNAGDKHALANVLKVIGSHSGIGFSPFAIETISDEGERSLTATYQMLGSLADIILDAQAKGRIAAFANPVAFDGTVDAANLTAAFGGYKINATTDDPWTPKHKQDRPTHGALLIWLGGEDFLVAGAGVTFTFEHPSTTDRVGLDTVEDGEFVEKQWRVKRRLNGDQTHQGRHVRLPPGLPTVQKFRLYRYR